MDNLLLRLLFSFLKYRIHESHLHFFTVQCRSRQGGF
jgi:hypothetical protein